LVSKDMLNRLKSEYFKQAYRRGLAINKIPSELEDQNIRMQLLEMNRIFNQFEFLEDHLPWGEQDYWATAEEFHATRKGNCEDFVIARYFALRKLGLPDGLLYLTDGKAVKQNVVRMVLSYAPTPASNPTDSGQL